MSKRNVVTAVAMIGAAGLFTGCNFSQPTAGCIVQDGVWQAKYTLKTTDAGPACNSLKGEALGVYKFSDFGKPNSTILTIRPEGAASLTRYYYEVPELDANGDPVMKDGEQVMEEIEVDRLGVDANGEPIHPSVATAESPFQEEPEADGFCSTQGFTKAAAVSALEVRNERDDSLLAEAQDVSYGYSNVKVYSDPTAPGTQLSGTFTYTVNGCTAEYDMVAMWPAVGCDPDSDKPADNCGEGSGINPDFDVVCDAELKACVPAKAIPSLK